MIVNKHILRGLKILLCLFALAIIVGDSIQSYNQFFSTPMDGDLPGGVVPAKDVKPVLSHPLGFYAIAHHEYYPNPNRFFSHWSLYHYFNAAVPWLGQYMDKTDALYAACASAKLIMQLMLLWLIAVMAFGKAAPWHHKTLLAMAFGCVFFQMYGYHHQMAIIDPAVTYDFFYALPCIWLIIYFLPYWLSYRHERTFPVWLHILWWIWIPVVTLSGPLNPGIIATICVLLLIRLLREKRMPSRLEWLTFAPVAVGSIYSLFLGLYNVISMRVDMPLWERYKVLPQGVWNILMERPAWLLLLGIMLVTSLVLWWRLPQVWHRWGKELRWIGAFALVYLLLLPLGGYRDYRPYIVRYDTILPVTLLVVYWIIGAVLDLLFHSRRWGFCFSVPYVLAIMIFFQLEDKDDPLLLMNNEQERRGIVRVQNSDQDIVELEHDWKIATWGPIAYSQAFWSELPGQMLYRFGIWDSPKKFYNKDAE